MAEVPSSPTRAQWPVAPEPLQKEVSHFDSVKLRHTTPEEKIVLPTQSDIAQEKQHQSFLNDVEEFKRTSLNPTNIEEKNPLPTKEEMAKEKIIEMVPSFDPSKLKHTTTVEKHTLEVIDDASTVKNGK